MNRSASFAAARLPLPGNAAAAPVRPAWSQLQSSHSGRLLHADLREGRVACRHLLGVLFIHGTGDHRQEKTYPHHRIGASYRIHEQTRYASRCHGVRSTGKETTLRRALATVRGRPGSAPSTHVTTTQPRLYRTFICLFPHSTWPKPREFTALVDNDLGLGANILDVRVRSTASGRTGCPLPTS